MKKQLGAWLGTWAALTFVGACGKADGASPVERAELPGAIAQISCDSLGACCKGKSYAFDAALCKQQLSAELRGNLEQVGLHVSYDAQAAGDCLAAAAASAVCGDFVGEGPPACERIFRGTLPLGEACSNSNECADPEGGDATCQGVCRAAASPARGKLGDSCSFSCEDEGRCFGFVDAVGAACYRGDGLHCQFPEAISSPGASMICQPLGALGQHCNDARSCVAGAVCPITSAICTPPLADGEPCSIDSECEAGVCDVTCGTPSLSAVDCAPQAPPSPAP